MADKAFLERLSRELTDKGKLIEAGGKGEKSDLTQGEKNQLKELSKLIAKEYATKVTKVGARR